MKTLCKALGLVIGLSLFSLADQCQITSPLPVPVSITGCTFSGSLPSNSTSYIQNTLSPTTTTQAFSVQTSSISGAEYLSYIAGTQCLEEMNGQTIGTGSACGSGSGGGVLLSSFSATSPVIYSSSTGVFSLGQVSLSTGAAGTLQAAQFPALTGDITTPGGSLVTTAAASQGNITQFTNGITFISSVTVTGGGGITDTYGIKAATAQLTSLGTNTNICTDGSSNLTTSSCNNGTVTSVGASAPITTTGGNTPSIGLSQTIGQPETFTSSLTVTSNAGENVTYNINVGSMSGSGLTSCSASTNALQWNSSTDLFSCQSNEALNNVDNNWTSEQTFGSSITVNGNGGETVKYQVNIGSITGAGLTSCSAASSAVTWNSTTDLFGCNTISSGGGGSSTLAVATGTSSGFSPPPTSSSTVVLLFDQATTNGQLLASSTYFFTLKSSSVTLQGNMNVALLNSTQTFTGQNTFQGTPGSLNTTEGGNTYSIFESTWYVMNYSSAVVTNALANLPGFGWTLPASSTWTVACNLMDSGAAGGNKYAFTGPTGATMTMSVFGGASLNTTFTSGTTLLTTFGTATSAPFNTSSTANTLLANGEVYTGNGGVFQLQREAGTGGDSVTLGPGPYCILTRLPQ